MVKLKAGLSSKQCFVSDSRCQFEDTFFFIAIEKNGLHKLSSQRLFENGKGSRDKRKHNKNYTKQFLGGKNCPQSAYCGRVGQMSPITPRMRWAIGLLVANEMDVDNVNGPHSYA